MDHPINEVVNVEVNFDKSENSSDMDDDDLASGLDEACAYNNWLSQVSSNWVIESEDSLV